MLYELWDTETHNLVNAYGTEREALIVVLAGIEENGPEDTNTLALDVADAEGRTQFIAAGQALAQLARDTLAPTYLAR